MTIIMVTSVGLVVVAATWPAPARRCRPNLYGRRLTCRHDDRQPGTYFMGSSWPFCRTRSRLSRRFCASIWRRHPPAT